MVHESNFEQVNRLVPSLGAKRKRSQAIKNAIRRRAAAAAAALGLTAPVSTKSAE